MWLVSRVHGSWACLVRRKREYLATSPVVKNAPSFQNVIKKWAVSSFFNLCQIDVGYGMTGFVSTRFESYGGNAGGTINALRQRMTSYLPHGKRCWVMADLRSTNHFLSTYVSGPSAIWIGSVCGDGPNATDLLLYRPRQTNGSCSLPQYWCSSGSY